MAMRDQTTFTLLLLATSAIAACESDTEARVQYGASLTGDKERPAVVTMSGTGTFAATVSGGAVLTYTLDFQGLSSNAVAANIRGAASDTDTASVIVDLDNVPATLGSGTATLGGTSGSASGTFRLTGSVAPGFGADSLRKLMDAGLLYVNVETTSYPAGEIRGQIRKQ
jgi:hypothetical protein